MKQPRGKSSQATIISNWAYLLDSPLRRMSRPPSYTKRQWNRMLEKLDQLVQHSRLIMDLGTEMMQRQQHQPQESARNEESQQQAEQRRDQEAQTLQAQAKLFKKNKEGTRRKTPCFEENKSNRPKRLKKSKKESRSKRPKWLQKGKEEIERSKSSWQKQGKEGKKPKERRLKMK